MRSYQKLIIHLFPQIIFIRFNADSSYFFLINRRDDTRDKNHDSRCEIEKLMKIFCNKSRLTMIVAAWYMVVKLTTYYYDDLLMVYRIIR